MLAAIQFHDQLGLGGIEIQDVGAQGALAVKPDAELIPAQMRPELLFGICLAAAQVAGQGFQAVFIFIEGAGLG